MGTDAHGWIEIKIESSPFWRPIIVIDAVPFRDYVVFGSIFGVRWGSADPSGKSLAADRGVPPDVSTYVKSEIILQGAGQHHHSWVLWSELQDTWLATEKISPFGNDMTHEWFALRGMMAVLAEYYGASNIRFVAWFNSN